MAGRLPKLGDEKCPKLDCVGYGELGRTLRHSRTKSKNPANFRCSTHYTFIHNDRKITEHYIKNNLIVDKKNPGLIVITELIRHFHSMGRFAKQLEEFPLEADEKKGLISVVQHEITRCFAIVEILKIQGMKYYCDRHNIPMPGELEILWKRVVESENYGKRQQELFDKSYQENPTKTVDDFVNHLVEINPMLSTGFDLYEKYLRPKRLERNRLRNKKLSEWSGRKTDDYTGIAANPTPSLLPS